MTKQNSIKIPPFLTGVIGITLAAIFISSIPFGVSFYIALFSVIISVSFYAVIFLNFKKRITRILVGLLAIFTISSIFMESNDDILGMFENWTDYNEIIASSFKLNVAKLFIALGGLIAPMTFLGIINN